jgi:hypothetical protein
VGVEATSASGLDTENSREAQIAHHIMHAPLVGLPWDTTHGDRSAAAPPSPPGAQRVLLSTVLWCVEDLQTRSENATLP